MSIPPEILQSIQAEISYSPTSCETLPGGSISHVSKVSDGNREAVIKFNTLTAYPGMLEVEAKSLQMLAEHSDFQIPEVLMFGTTAQYQFIVMDYMQPADKHPDYWTQFARRLAGLHREQSERYGLPFNNYIGSLAQDNEPATDWVEFFYSRRLMRQVNLAERSETISPVEADRFRELEPVLRDELSIESPTLIHGDLWSGNVITGSDGHATIIDPAVYYGHREVDIAMAQLFGGFDTRFYDAYQEIFPLVPGWQFRAKLYQLYPLLVHVNLFGRNYMGQIDRILSHIGH